MRSMPVWVGHRTMKIARLDEFCDFSPGGKLKLNKSHYIESGYPAFSAAGQDGFVEKWEHDSPAVVVSSIGSCGKAFLATGRWTSLANTYIVFPDVERCLPEYLWYLLNDETSWIISGTAQPFIKSSDIKAREIPLPPLTEQRRIAGILNRATRIERLRAQATARLRSLAPALFVKTFGDPASNPMGWPVARLGDVATVAAGDPAPQHPEAFAANGPLFVRMQDVGRGHVNPALSASTDRLDPSWPSRQRLRLFPKDSTLIPKSGASVNLNHRAMLATEAHVVSHLAVLTPDRAKVEPEYMFWWSVHYDPREQAQVTSLPSLKLSTLKEAPIPLPPLTGQRRFARLARQIDRLAKTAATASQTAAALTASLMDRLLNPAPPS